jgi:hypothetical protein
MVSRNLEDNFNMKLGADYFLTRKTTIGFVSTGLINPEKNWSDNKSYLKDANGVTDSIVLAESSTTNKWKNGTLNLNFRHQFDSTGRELTADPDYASYSSGGNQTFITSTLTPDIGTILDDQKLRGFFAGSYRLLCSQADYVQQAFKGKLKTGVKSSYVTTRHAANC